MAGKRKMVASWCGTQSHSLFKNLRLNLKKLPVDLSLDTNSSLSRSLLAGEQSLAVPLAGGQRRE
jgi:hypothetical protein